MYNSCIKLILNEKPICTLGPIMDPEQEESIINFIKNKKDVLVGKDDKKQLILVKAEKNDVLQELKKKLEHSISTGVTAGKNQK